WLRRVRGGRGELGGPVLRRDVRGRPAGLVPRAVCVCGDRRGGDGPGGGAADTCARVAGRPPRPRMARKEKETAGAGAGWAVARGSRPAAILPDVGLLDVNAMVGARTDAGTVGASYGRRRHRRRACGCECHACTPAERRALVPDSYIVLVRGEGEREADAHARLVRYPRLGEVERLRQLGGRGGEGAARGRGRGGGRRTRARRARRGCAGGRRAWTAVQ
ncbi:hypothetical protein B0H14DRAFT_3708505, partial [Mycena olivaceomarginata]